MEVIPARRNIRHTLDFIVAAPRTIRGRSSSAENTATGKLRARLETFNVKKGDVMKGSNLDRNADRRAKDKPVETTICDNQSSKEENLNNRRNFLKVGSAALVAASIPSVAAGAPEDTQKVFYAHGMAWNPELPGILAELRLTFDIAVRLGGTGLGTFGDDVHPEFNSHFKINSTAKHGNVYTLEGEITAARDPAMVGMPVTIVAEVEGSTTGVAITLGTHTFKGAGLVVIAIIAILIGLLLPA